MSIGICLGIGIIIAKKMENISMSIGMFIGMIIGLMYKHK